MKAMGFAALNPSYAAAADENPVLEFKALH
jgi:hypothetical protein